MGKMPLFSFLNKKTLNKYEKTEEYQFYMKNKEYLLPLNFHYHLVFSENNAFKIIQANILIKAMMNKEIYDETLKRSQDELLTIIDGRNEYLKSKIWKALDENQAIYFEKDATRIYLPIYSRAMNLIYNDDPIKLLEYPYTEIVKDARSSCIDLFDLYNYDLYASPFTHLIKIKEDKTSCAFYHPDFETIFIINDQGRLDIAIPLFDKYLKERDHHLLMKRVANVVDDFYSNERKKFVRSLRDNGLISSKMCSILLRKESIRSIRRTKVALKGKSIDEIL